ncbi:MAG: D-alanine--D-alanine ligase [Muribaculaceae bacterium]|jgi:D-alanine-D-alanine ligase|nr:D-alanine--D-alanine ligase [Muribaculaceae bacterium]
MKTNIAVFFGGRSTEHEISVISANQAMAAMDSDKYNVIPVYITKDGRWYTGSALTDVKNYRNTAELLKQCTQVYMRPVYGDYNLYKAERKMFGSDVLATLDAAIPVLHGSNGEDGIFEGVLETIGIPFAGCATLASANGMDKITMKMILAADGIPVVDYVWFTDKQWFAHRDDLIAKVESKLGYPVIVKPANLGSSVGIGRADNREDLLTKVDDARRYSARIIVEDLVENLQEINCSVLGDCDEYRTSVLEEPIKSGEILSYTDKYMGGTKDNRGMHASKKRIPADLPQAETDRIRFLAGETFRVLSCHGVSRVDMMIDAKTRDIYVNEINTIPGSLSFYLWEAAGLKFNELMDELVRLAFKRKRDQSTKTVSYDSNIFALGGGVKGAKGAKA